MSAPILWIVIPSGAAVILFLLRRWQRLVTLVGVFTTLSFAWLAWAVPIGEPILIRLGFTQINIQLTDTLFILGRRFVLTNLERPVLTLVYIGISYWFLGAFTAKINRLFIPLGLAISALLISALTVKPFLYAALIIEMAVLLSIIILSPPGNKVGQGVLRFLTYQTLGMPLILLAGWFVNSASPDLSDSGFILRAFLLVGLGFSLWIAVFPFHTWLPMVAEESHPYVAAFVFCVLPTVIALFGLTFLKSYAWLRELPLSYISFRVIGTLMILVGGFWSCFQKHLGRIFGYAAILDIGYMLQALSLLGKDPIFMAGAADGTQSVFLTIFFFQIIPKGIGLAAWAQSLSLIRSRTGNLSYDGSRGIGRQMPIVVIGLLFANLTLIGFPLFAGFPARLALWTYLANQSPPTLLLSLAGSLGLLIGGLRSIGMLIEDTSQNKWRISESRPQIIYICLTCILILLLGLLPNLLLPAMNGLSQAVTGPVP